MKPTTLAAAVVALATMLAAPALAGGGAPPGGGSGGDPDVEFSHELQGYGIYGPRDYNAWLGKIVCERLRAGRDPDAATSVRFIVPNIYRNGSKQSTEAEGWQFLGASINAYCPDQRGVFDRAAAQQG